MRPRRVAARWRGPRGASADAGRFCFGRGRRRSRHGLAYIIAGGAHAPEYDANLSVVADERAVECDIAVYFVGTASTAATSSACSSAAFFKIARTLSSSGVAVMDSFHLCDFHEAYFREAYFREPGYR